MASQKDFYQIITLGSVITFKKNNVIIVYQYTEIFMINEECVLTKVKCSINLCFAVFIRNSIATLFIRI